jgi:hypothetical protein
MKTLRLPLELLDALLGCGALSRDDVLGMIGEPDWVHVAAAYARARTAISMAREN